MSNLQRSFSQFSWKSLSDSVSQMATNAVDSVLADDGGGEEDAPPADNHHPSPSPTIQVPETLLSPTSTDELLQPQIQPTSAASSSSSHASHTDLLAIRDEEVVLSRSQIVHSEKILSINLVLL